MQLKAGVNVTGIKVELLLALTVAERVYNEEGYPLVITSLLDSKHSLTSLHYAGCAADLRTRHINTIEEVNDIASKLKSSLTKDYDVIVEKDHIHLEWQPRRP